MADEVLKIDSNNKVVAGAVTDDASQEIRNMRIDNATKGLKVKLVGGVGMGDVTGPASSVADNIATYADTTGKTIKDSGVSISSLVPYTGSSTDLDLNAKSFKNFFISKTIDVTAKMGFDVSGLSTATTRTLTVPNRSFTLDNITTSTTTTGTGFLKGNGSVISFDNSTYLTSVGTGVANEITYWSGTNTLGSLTTATYPSLTELSYVKGVTSAIQTQINSKAPTAGSTGQAFSVSTLDVGNADTTISRVSAGVIAVEGVTVPTETSTNTLTNKRHQPRIVSAASYTTDTGTSLSVATCDEFVITAQAGALKFNNPGGTPAQGEKIIIRIKDNGTAIALTYDTQYRAMGNTLPSTTVLSKTLYMGFIYNSDDTKWDLVAVAQEA